ncbi:hypothetical protein DJ95_981 [Bacillus atrophaeus subsp. globigii]|uniref:Uncharacterized protein n=1 Tax=Bacillus atrophaeus (strain 1942) TaxID=720555 RepID=A0ABM5LVX6_BACA1|nr:hypothetical protein BATR1942_05320 [Bacillus atrophaeus 1942]AIK46582.1 hypothetical protein DJ95_981 [Bacillus atrophaeus subsp. globigii]AKL84272.1 hypothetical protein D068_cds15620 [Bacillus atrophaeus UCMB-5137]EIM08604.1 hypothetical protein UY9_21294 [Bacillus atrophaeus C89]KFK82653.1 hypothetical protein DK44_2656 [Bacillus atrophaeus]MCI3194434.1 hypothetical protein [Bacillus sp. HU-1818]
MIIAFINVFVNIFSLQHNAVIKAPLTAEYAMHTLNKTAVKSISFANVPYVFIHSKKGG